MNNNILTRCSTDDLLAILHDQKIYHDSLLNEKESMNLFMSKTVIKNKIYESTMKIKEINMLLQIRNDLSS